MKPPIEKNAGTLKIEKEMWELLEKSRPDKPAKQKEWIQTPHNQD